MNDDAVTKAEVRKVLEAAGCFPVDRGGPDVGGRTNFIKI